MSKAKTPRALKGNEAMATASVIQASPRKVNLVAQMIRGLGAQPAIANAENNHSLDVDRLVVAEAVVGRSLKLKRFHARARGRGARVVKTWSNITVVVRERADQEEKA